MDPLALLPLVFCLVVGCVSGYLVGFRRGSRRVRREYENVFNRAKELRDRRIKPGSAKFPPVTPPPVNRPGVRYEEPATVELGTIGEEWDGFPTERSR